MAKLESLFELDEEGAVTEVRGVEVQQEEQVIAVLTEQEGVEPPRSTSWALSAAYQFAEQLQGQGEAAVLDALEDEK
jgi:hypothetical protein